MSALSDAIDRMDVMEFKPQQVMILRTALSKLQDDINPPKSRDEVALLERTMELSELFEKWWNMPACRDCGGKEHEHYLSCSVFRQLMEDQKHD
jgi:hypothetical protein